MQQYRGGRRIGVLSGSGGECTLVSDAAANVGVEVPELTEATKASCKRMACRLRQHEQSPRRHRRHVRRRQDLSAPASRADRRRQHRRGDDQSRSERSQAERIKERQPLCRGHRKSRDHEHKPIAVSAPSWAVRWIPRFCCRFARPACRSWKAPNARQPRSGIWLNIMNSQKNQLAGGTKPEFRNSPKLPSGILPRNQAFRLLERFAIPVVPTVLARTLKKPRRVSAQLGFPVALKIESADIRTKAMSAGWRCGFETAADVREAFGEMQNPPCRSAFPMRKSPESRSSDGRRRQWK